jgi:hypothetical protein
MDALYERIARALGWSVQECRSVSLQSLREMVRTAASPKLIRDINDAIRTGTYVSRPQHTHDDDCILGEDDVCVECGVWHGPQCVCGGRGYHNDKCPVMADEEAQRLAEIEDSAR